MYFFPSLCAFNINWNEQVGKPKTIKSYIVDPNTGNKKAILVSGQESEFYEGISPTKRFEKCTEILRLKNK